MADTDWASTPRKTLASSVADAIREKIITNQIKGGEALRQDALANQLNVSRIPVREALLQLEAEGLVTFVPHKGAVASSVSLEEVEELFALRVLLECDIISVSISNSTAESFEKSESILKEFDALLKPGSDMRELGTLNWQFHQSLYEPAARTRTLAIISGLHTHCDRYLRMQIQLTEDYERAEAEHHELLSLCKSGQKTAARKLLRTHIKTTGDELIRAISALRLMK
jgi:DNA-binding GntR family transcriptional regulator